MFENLRRLCDDAYRAQDGGMSVGLPVARVDVSQLKHLLDHCDAMHDENARLKAELQEARRDSERLEWCVRHDVEFCSVVVGGYAVTYCLEDSEGAPFWWDTEYHDNWRDAIDEAMRSESGEDAAIAKVRGGEG